MNDVITSADTEVLGLKDLVMDAVLENQAILYPETITWHHPQGNATCRCSLVSVTDMPFRDAQRFLSVPDFNSATGALRVHPNDKRPLTGSTCEHPRFGTVRVAAWGAEAFWTGSRLGALTWSR